jgi:hypothetical protein
MYSIRSSQRWIDRAHPRQCSEPWARRISRQRKMSAVDCHDSYPNTQGALHVYLTQVSGEMHCEVDMQAPFFGTLHSPLAQVYGSQHCGLDWQERPTATQGGYLLLTQISDAGQYWSLVQKFLRRSIARTRNCGKAVTSIRQSATKVATKIACLIAMLAAFQILRGQSKFKDVHDTDGSNPSSEAGNWSVRSFG